MVTAEQLDAARDVALRCFRSYSAFLTNTFVRRYSKGRRRPIGEIQEKLADDLHLLARILAESREKVTPEVIDAILVASGDGPPPTAESTWHELAVAAVLRVLSTAETETAIDWPAGELCPAPLQLSHVDDAGRLRGMVLSSGAKTITRLVDGWKPGQAETLGDVEVGVHREWAAARKTLSREKPAEPANAEHILAGVLRAAAGDDAPIRAVMAIAHDKTLTAEQKMVKILLDSTNRRFEAFNSSSSKFRNLI